MKRTHALIFVLSLLTLSVSPSLAQVSPAPQFSGPARQARRNPRRRRNLIHSFLPLGCPLWRKRETAVSDAGDDPGVFSGETAGERRGAGSAGMARRVLSGPGDTSQTVPGEARTGLAGTIGDRT